MSIDKFPEHIKELYKNGKRCGEHLLALLDEWPIGEYSRRIEFSIRTDRDREKIREAMLDMERWIKALSIQRTLHDKRKLKDILKTLEYAVLEEDFKDNSKEDVKRAIGEALSLITSIPLPGNADRAGYKYVVPNTALILMSMDPSQSKYEVVCDAIKLICYRFGIQAFRVDDIQHPYNIIDVIFECMTTSEFLIADLTGENQNVYYEVGRAHGLNKHPILFREYRTKLHFNLSVHNVPEYKNPKELKKLLQDRLEAMLGRKAA
jgi:hypothetical protein